MNFNGLNCISLIYKDYNVSSPMLTMNNIFTAYDIATMSLNVILLSD